MVFNAWCANTITRIYSISGSRHCKFMAFYTYLIRLEQCPYAQSWLMLGFEVLGNTNLLHHAYKYVTNIEALLSHVWHFPSSIWDNEIFSRDEMCILKQSIFTQILSNVERTDCSFNIARAESSSMTQCACSYWHKQRIIAWKMNVYQWRKNLIFWVILECLLAFSRNILQPDVNRHKWRRHFPHRTGHGFITE